MSLPEYGGMDTGFNIYHGADPSEYDLVLSNSEGGLGRLREMGAKRAEALFWGADPELFAPLPVEKEHDVFFYAYGDKFRRNWMGELIGEPSRRLAEVDFVLGGTDFRGDVGRARELGYFPVNLLSHVISASRINLNVARKPHAEVYASSTSRLFELAAAGAAIVTNPYEGIERWFEPGRELLVVSGADEAVEAYRSLLDDPASAAELGRRARERVLGEHTFADRARRLLDLAGVRPRTATAVT
jgi:spore maturation protein CgeB